MKIIVGGGISGLWLAAELRSRNIPCLILEKAALGEAQTLSSQGMIHGGTKYAIDGVFTRAASEISGMPDRWRMALQGRGPVNLRGVELESNSQLLWSVESVHENLIAFFASKLMKSRMERVDPKQEEAFASPEFKGHLYRLSEPVIKLNTLIARFIEILADCLFQAEVVSAIYELNQIVGVKTDRGDVFGEVILTSGEGIEKILSNSGITTPKMQRRPLAMGVVKLETAIPKIFGHQIGIGAQPKLTISTHDINKQQYLYLGGQVAEEGCNRDDQTQTKAFEQALAGALPWLSPKIAQLSIYRINRAEPYSDNGKRPDSAHVSSVNGIHVCWPTKLALAPALADQVIPRLKPSRSREMPKFPIAKQGQCPWL